MGIKIIALPQAPSLQNTDVFPISQDYNGVRQTKRITVNQIVNYLNYIPRPTNDVNNNGKSLIYEASTQTWKASSIGNFIIKPSYPNAGEILTYSNNTWVASALSSVGSGLYIPKPETASDKQVLTYNDSTSTWNSSSLSSVGFNALLSSEGWQELPSGLIMQWGNVAFVGGSNPSVTVKFPRQFPNQAVFATAIRTTSNATIVERTLLTNLSATFSMIDREQAINVSSGTLNWQAIGY